MGTLTKTGVSTKTKIVIGVAIAFGAIASAMIAYPMLNRAAPQKSTNGYGYNYTSKCPSGQVSVNGVCKVQKRGAPRRGNGILGG